MPTVDINYLSVLAAAVSSMTIGSLWYGPIFGLMAGFWNWLGFIAPVTLGVVLWEGKPWKLWILSSGYYLISLLVMGIILAIWP